MRRICASDLISRHSCLILILIVCCSSASSSANAAQCAAAPLKSLFYQPQTVDLTLSSQQWRRRMLLLRDSGFTSIYLQWTAHADVDFIKQTTSDGRPFLPSLAESALAADIKLHFGLWADPNWFERTSSTGSRETYLKLVQVMSLQQASALVEYMAPGSIEGWYLTEEINDRDWQGRSSRLELYRHIELMVTELQKLSPGKPVSISSYVGGEMLPVSFANFWVSLLQIDGLFMWFQDGSGTQALQVAKRAQYRNMLTSRLDKSDWGIIVELFDQTRSRGSEFVARPAKIDALTKRVRQARESRASIPLNSFSLRYLFLNEGRLLVNYRSYYCSADRRG